MEALMDIEKVPSPPRDEEDPMDITPPSPAPPALSQLRLDEASLVLAIQPKETQSMSVFMWPGKPTVLMPMPRSKIVFRVPHGTLTYILKNRLSSDIYYALKLVSDNEVERVNSRGEKEPTLVKKGPTVGPATAELSDILISKGGYPQPGSKWFPYSTGGRVPPLPGDGPNAPVEDELTFYVSHHVAFCIAMPSLLWASKEGSRGLKCMDKIVTIRWPSSLWTTRDLISLYMEQLDCEYKLRLGASLALAPHREIVPMVWNNVQIQELMHLTGSVGAPPPPPAPDIPELKNPLQVLDPPPVVVEKTAGTWVTVLNSREPPPKEKKKAAVSTSSNRPKTKREQGESNVKHGKGQLSIAAAFARPAKRAKVEEKKV